jgi:3-deoxy-7-phosphoheptulonate synthase
VTSTRELMQQTEDLNVSEFGVMPSPDEVKAKVPLDDPAAETVLQSRHALEAILDGRDRRLFVVVGPCSIHDPAAGLDYARRLRALAEEASSTIRTWTTRSGSTRAWSGRAASCTT